MKYELVFILRFLLPMIHAQINQKCCDENEILHEINSTFRCEFSADKRLQSNFENINSMRIINDSDCIDIYAGRKTAMFHIDKNQRLSKKRDLSMETFPKCCPLGHSYNTIFHSCVKNTTKARNENIDANIFLKIGLKECDIISDHIVNFSIATFLPELQRKVRNRTYCLDSTTNEKTVVRICEDNIQVCGQIRCIIKCCPDGQSYVGGPKCQDTFINGLSLNFTDKIHEPNEPFAIVHGIKGDKASVRLTSNFSIDRGGTFHGYMALKNLHYYYNVLDRHYCMESIQLRNGENRYRLYLKSIDMPVPTKITITKWIKIISCVFFLLTILVYLLLPTLNLFGRILICYCTSTFFFFLTLTISQFYGKFFSDKICVLTGFINVLGNLWSFTWLNIMCIDIWSSFGTPRPVSKSFHRGDLGRLIKYSIYGWGIPIVWILVIYLFYTTSILPKYIQPIVGETQCYLEKHDSQKDNYAYVLFVAVPLMVQQVVNLVFFIKTVNYCWKTRAEIKKYCDSKRQSELNENKQKLSLMMKLGVIMGITFIFETVSSLYDFQKTKATTYIEVVGDTLNCLQGVYVFLIFVCKKRIYMSIREQVPSSKTSVNTEMTHDMSLDQIRSGKN